MKLRRDFIVAGCVVLALAVIRPSSAGVGLDRLLGGLSSPVGIVSPRDGSGRLFIVEQTGAIRVHAGGKLLSKAFLDLTARVSCCGERGLLGLVFHPSYPADPRLFVYYTNSAGNLTVASYRVSKDTNVADPKSARTLLTVPHTKYSNHNGGQLQFGPDGYLYIGTGDGGSGGDPDNNSQNLTVLLGKLLRIDVDSGEPYRIPPDNPFVGGSTSKDDPVWAYGLRNPWRFSFDRKTGDLYIGDVGQNCYEEVDFQKRGSIGGQNYGWRILEGTRCYDSQGSCTHPPTCNRAGLTLPILSYVHSGSCNAITGGFVYRGSRVPELAGRYLYSDYCSGLVWAARKVSGRWASKQILSTGLAIASFGEDEDGELYLASIDSGEIFRFVANGDVDIEGVRR